MKFLKVAVLFFGLAAAFAVRAQGGTYPVSGRVIDRLSRRPVAYAAVVLAGQEQKEPRPTRWGGSASSA